MVDTNGTVVAHREYDPFGGTIALTGSKKDGFVFWFSSKYTDEETGLVYYGYRYYSPTLGRWLSRDPIGHRGGLNLYGFVDNNPADRTDKLGLTWEACLASAKLKITIDTTPAGAGRGTFDVKLEVELKRDDCICICESPEIRQQARQHRGRIGLFWYDTQMGMYIINTDWADDPIDESVGTRYSAETGDLPGDILFWQPTLGFAVEARTWAVCGAGSQRGSMIGGKHEWGVEAWDVFTIWPPRIWTAKRKWGDGTFSPP